VTIGDQVEISGWTHAGEAEVHAATITNVGSGKAVEVDVPPPAAVSESAVGRKLKEQ